MTALAYDMPSMVAGRFLQGVGGGGLVPATLALVADLYPPHRRGVPLGVVSAVQEIGSVIGPLFGAVVLAFTDWRAIFAHQPRRRAGARRRHPPGRAGPARGPAPASDLVGLGGLLALTLVAGALVFLRPPPLLRDLTWGQAFIPFAGDGRWLTPVGVVAMAAAVAFLAWCTFARAPLFDVRRWVAALREADLTGALLLAVALAGVILAFATADPKVQVFSDQGLWFLLGSAVAAVLFVVHLRRATAPLVPRGALRRTPAWGALLVSFFIGAALIAALIDIPLFARTTVYPDSQLLAALVLVRFLVALPVGAVVGGYLIRSLSPGVVTAAGHGAGGGRVRADDPLGPHLAVGVVGQRRAGGVRLRLRPRPGPGQRRAARLHRRRRARGGERLRGRGPDGRHAGRASRRSPSSGCAATTPSRPTCRPSARSATGPAAATSSPGSSSWPASPRSTPSSGARPGCAVVAGVLALVLFAGARTDRVSARDALSAH